MAIGAYVSLYLMEQWQWSLPFAALAAVFVGMIVAVPLGWLTCRLDRFSFAVLGFSFTYLVWMLFSSQSLKDFTGGELGKPVAPGQLFGVTLDGLAGYAAVSIAVLAACALASILFRSRMGRILLTMREDDIVASSVGVNVNALRIGVTAIVSGFGALGGVLVGQASGFVAPAQYEVSMSIVLLSMALVGGVNYLLGPFVGAILLQVGPAMLGLTLVDRDLFAGVVLLGCLIFLPDGVLAVVGKYLGVLFQSRTGRRRADAK
jgi:branched-chain amino acid transport system permease protein